MKTNPERVDVIVAVIDNVERRRTFEQRMMLELGFSIWGLLRFYELSNL